MLILAPSFSFAPSREIKRMDSRFRGNGGLLVSGRAIRPQNLHRRLRSAAFGLRHGRHPAPRRMHASRAGRRRAEPPHPFRRRTASLPSPRLRRPRRSARREAARPQLRAWWRRHHLELGKLEARHRARPPGPQRPGRGGRLGRDGALDRSAGAGGRVRGHHLHRRASAGHDLEHRRRPVPPLRGLPRRRDALRVHGPVHPRARLQLAALPDHGRRRLRHPLAPDLCRDRQPRSEAARKLPAGEPYADRGREPVPVERHAPLRHDVRRDRPLPPPDDPRRADRRREDRGAQVRDACRHRRLARIARLQLHRARQPRAVQRPGPAARPAASSRSSSRSPRSATPSPAARATCSRGPTGSSSAARSRSASGTRRPTPGRSPRSSPATEPSTPPFAAPLEVPPGGPDIRG